MIYRFEGNMRNGKTLGMVQWGLLFRLATIAVYKIPTRIYVNFPVSFPATRFENWRELETAKNAIIMFDEIDTAIDSRNFKSEDQQEMTHLFKQMGKLGNTFMYTSQRDHMVEKRIREQTDFVIKCQKSWTSGRLIQQWYDSQCGQTIEEWIPLHRYVNTAPHEFYKLYDSFAVVKSTLKREEKIPKYAPYKSKHY